MGFRFRKSFRVLPGIRLNLSKSGFSTSIGRPGAMINIGRRGVTGTAGLPGIGLSYSQHLIGRSSGSSSDAPTQAAGCWLVVAVIAAILLVFQCSAPVRESPADERIVALEQNQLEQVFVSARSLNCRSKPVRSAEVLTKLTKGMPAEVMNREAEWSQVSAAGVICWASNEYLSATPIAETPLQLAAPAPSVTPNRRASFINPASPAAEVGCPCSGRQVCVGPRGGRYCITRAGNKRYGV